MATTVSCRRKGTKPVPAARLVTGVAVVAALISGTVLLTGCQRPPDDPKIIVVAASATANEPAPVLSGPDRARLRDAGSTSTRAAAFVVNPNTGQAREVSLTPRRPDGQVDYGPDRNSELGANVTRVQHLLSTLAASTPFDLLAMIARAVRVTASTEQESAPAA